jgi:hypothetical protein
MAFCNEIVYDRKKQKPMCKKCNGSLEGHMGKKKEVCPSEHGHVRLDDGYLCGNEGCDKTFTTLHSAHKHSKSVSCKHYKGIDERVSCLNNCGRTFGGGSAKSNAFSHANSTMCPNHPDRVSSPDYRTTISHAISPENTKYCNQCKEQKHVDHFAKKDNSKNGTNRDYVCYKCRAILAMRSNAMQRAKKEKNPTNDLTLDYIRSLVVHNCPVFGMELQYGSNVQSHNSATIDARIHSKGHVKGNLCIISHRANTIKNNATSEEIDKLASALETWKEPLLEDTSKNVLVRKKTEACQTNKQCTLCREIHTLDMFHKSSSATKLGISNKCIRCTALCTMIKNAKQRCKVTGRPIDIDNEYLYQLTKNLTHCPVLGVPLLFGGTGKIKDNSASIDRFDQTKGYVKGNVWIICYKANRMKSDATLEDIKKVQKYMHGCNETTK